MRLGLGVLAVVAGAATGCAPDRQDEAYALEADLNAMSGAADVLTVYDHGIETGDDITVSVTLADGAKPSEIRAVVRRIDEAYAEEFDDYDQEVQLQTSSADLSYLPKQGKGAAHVDLDADLVVDDLARATALAVKIGDDDRTVGWGRTGKHPSVQVPAAGVRSFGLVHEALDGDPAGVSFAVHDSETEAFWTAGFPLDEADGREALAAVAASAPHIRRVDVTDGHLDRVSLVGLEPEGAYKTMARIIDRIAPSEQHPVLLSWDEEQESGHRDERTFAGEVDAGGCRYSPNRAGEMEAEKYYTAEAIALQKRLRDEFDAC